MPAIVKRINFGSAAYLQALALRDEVLRKPLGLKLTTNDTAEDSNRIHYGLWEAQTLLACVQFQIVSECVLQLKQMAVATQYQKTGLGRELIVTTEKIFKRAGIKEIFMHARKYALPFYLNQGYQIRGSEFEEVGIAHLELYKYL